MDRMRTRFFTIFHFFQKKRMGVADASQWHAGGITSCVRWLHQPYVHLWWFLRALPFPTCVSRSLTSGSAVMLLLPSLFALSPSHRPRCPLCVTHRSRRRWPSRPQRRCPSRRAWCVTNPVRCSVPVVNTPTALHVSAIWCSIKLGRNARPALPRPTGTLPASVVGLANPVSRARFRTRP